MKSLTNTRIESIARDIDKAAALLRIAASKIDDMAIGDTKASDHYRLEELRSVRDGLRSVAIDLRDEAIVRVMDQKRPSNKGLLP